MESRNPTDLARALYAALAAGDREQLDALLHPEFTGRTAEGMPFGIGGDHDSPAAMRRNGWSAIARHFVIAAAASTAPHRSTRLLHISSQSIRGASSRSSNLPTPPAGMMPRAHCGPCCWISVTALRPCG